MITAPQISIVYTDRGTGARLGVTVYGPTLSAIPKGYYMVGMSAVPATSNAGNRQMLFLVNPEGDSNAIRTPLGFNLVWKDKGSGGAMDGSFWSVTCPIPYVSLGDVAVGSWSAPSNELKSKFACIHYQHVINAKLGNLIWNDQKSDADSDVSLWETENIQSSSKQGLVGFFKANHAHSRPNAQVFGLPVRVQ